jgi:hypothetical protein
MAFGCTSVKGNSFVYQYRNSFIHIAVGMLVLWTSKIFVKGTHLIELFKELNKIFLLYFSGMIGFFVVLCLLLIIAVIIWLPKNAGIYPMLHWSPQYRSLGKPPPVPRYLRYDPDHWPEKPL